MSIDDNPQPYVSQPGANLGALSRILDVRVCSTLHAMEAIISMFAQSWNDVQAGCSTPLLCQIY